MQNSAKSAILVASPEPRAGAGFELWRPRNHIDTNSSASQRSHRASVAGEWACGCLDQPTEGAGSEGRRGQVREACAPEVNKLRRDQPMAHPDYALLTMRSVRENHPRGVPLHIPKE